TKPLHRHTKPLVRMLLPTLIGRLRCVYDVFTDFLFSLYPTKSKTMVKTLFFGVEERNKLRLVQNISERMMKIQQFSINHGPFSYALMSLIYLHHKHKSI